MQAEEQEPQQVNLLREPPSQKAKEEARTFDRDYMLKENKDNSLYKATIVKHRQEIMNLPFPDGINAKILATGFPNAKANWFNRFIKAISNGRNKFSQAEKEYIERSWVTDAFREEIEKLIKAKNVTFDSNKCTYGNYPWKGGAASCKKGVLTFDFDNPGYYDTLTGEYVYFDTAEEMNREYEKNNGVWLRSMRENIKKKNEEKHSSCACKALPDKINKIEDSLKVYDEAQSLIHLLEDLDHKMKSIEEIHMTESQKGVYHKFLKHIATKGSVDVSLFKELTEAFSNFRSSMVANYAMTVLNPWKYKAVKAPSELPIPSATFSIRSSINLITNNKGNLAFAFDPYYLVVGSFSSFGLNNNDLLVGTAVSNFFLATDIGQNLPAAIYSKYRCVSAGIKLQVTSSYLNTTGYASVGLQFSAGGVAATGSAITTYQNFGNFNQIENAYYRQTVPLRSGEIIEQNWLPIDPTFLTFTDLGVGGKNCTIVGYIAGGPQTTTVARLEFIMNMEAIVDLAYVDYIPQDISYEIFDPKDLRVIHTIFQQSMSNDTKVSSEEVNSLLEKEFPSVPVPLLLPSVIDSFGLPITSIAKNVGNILKNDIKELSKIDKEGAYSEKIEELNNKLSENKNEKPSFLSKAYNIVKEPAKAIISALGREIAGKIPGLNTAISIGSELFN